MESLASQPREREGKHTHFFQLEPWPPEAGPDLSEGVGVTVTEEAWSGHPAPGARGIHREEAQPYIHTRKRAPWGVHFAPRKAAPATDRATATRPTFRLLHTASCFPCVPPESTYGL